MCAAVMTPEKAEEILLSSNKEGCFILRNSTSGGLYSLSVLIKMYNHPQVIHYPIQQNHQGKFYISGAQLYSSVQELINFHQQHKGGLATRLTCSPCSKPIQTNKYYSKDDAVMEVVKSGQTLNQPEGCPCEKNVVMKASKPESRPTPQVMKASKPESRPTSQNLKESFKRDY